MPVNPRSRAIAIAAALVVVLAGCGGAPNPSPTGAALAPTPTPAPTRTPTPSATATPTATSGAPTRPSHVFVVVLENKSASQALGRHADYLKSLADRYGLATYYVAASHPSQPNYMELFSGSTQGVTDDDPHDIDAPTLADQLEVAGLTCRVLWINR
ncbi:MAG: hypothetical protein ABI534_11665 [Chloroflexota bacterium]